MRLPVLPILAVLSALTLGGLASAQSITQAAIASDPAPDAKYPARMEAIHVPTGGVEVNGIAYVASGPGPHPCLVLFHGLPGNEKNLDLAQAVRRAGWTVVTINYRGSWGSPGQFHFAQNLQDADAVLRFVRDSSNAKWLAIDPGRIAIGGHSMGGWVTAETFAHDRNLLGAVTISAGDMGLVGRLARSQRAVVVKSMSEDRESLTGATGENMTDELAAHADEWSFATLAPKLVGRRLLVLYSHDFVEAHSAGLIAAIKAAGGSEPASADVATDHAWSDHRIALQTLVIDWLRALPNKP